jgi:hypothetical protein
MNKELTKLQLASEISKITNFSEQFLLNRTEDELRKTYDMLIGKGEIKIEKVKINKESVNKIATEINKKLSR